MNLKISFLLDKIYYITQLHLFVCINIFYCLQLLLSKVVIKKLLLSTSNQHNLTTYYYFPFQDLQLHLCIKAILYIV